MSVVLLLPAEERPPILLSESVENFVGVCKKADNFSLLDMYAARVSQVVCCFRFRYSLMDSLRFGAGGGSGALKMGFKRGSWLAVFVSIFMGVDNFGTEIAAEDAEFCKSNEVAVAVVNALAFGLCGASTSQFVDLRSTLNPNSAAV